MPASAGFQTWPPCLESCSFGALHRRRWAPTNPGSIAAAIEIRRASGVAGTTIANLPVRSRLPGRVGSSAARNSSRSTRPRQVLTERSGSAAGPITHAVVYSDRHPARSATALRQDQTNFSAHASVAMPALPTAMATATIAILCNANILMTFPFVQMISTRRPNGPLPGGGATPPQESYRSSRQTFA